MFRIPPFGHVEKARRLHRIFQISLQIPSATRACLSCALADTIVVLPSVGLKPSVEAVESITKKNLIMLVSKPEVTRNTNSRHSFGDGIHPRKHRRTDR
jgi:hypothetical protein